MSILNNIKKGVQQSGSNKGKMLYLKADSKTRIRFLHEIEDGLEVMSHDSFDKGIDAICQGHVGKQCPYCEDEGLRHRNAYVWSVWDYEAKEVKLFKGFANNFNPLPSFIAMYESYGTMMDRDYIIQRDGGGTSTKYSVIPMDKAKFRNKKAKPYSEKKTLQILDKAFPVDSDDVIDNDDNDSGNDDDWGNDENEYDDMSPKELYMECIERDIKVKKKQKKKYYIDLLVEYDEENDDDNDDDDDDWEDDDEDDDDEW